MTRTQKFYDQVNEELLWEDKNGRRYFYNAVCEAKFVFRNNMCLPVLSEFLKNTDAVDGKFIKQDCELKAAYRLIGDFFKYIFGNLVAEAVAADEMNSLKYAILIEPKTA